MKMKVIIHGEFPGMNEFIKANRTMHGKWNAGNSMKQRDQGIIAAQIPKCRFEKPVWITYRYYCPNKKKDLDNISGYFHKVFQDALVARGVIPNDNWKYIKGFQDEFDVDRNNPRIEVEVKEV
jgi:Holliday junction resolvase RusA-like endonuclease